AFASLPPSCRQVRTSGVLVALTRTWRTFIQHQGNVTAERGLNLHRYLRRNKSRRPIDVILEMHALLCDLAEFHERKNLVAAAICQNRPIPIHKAVQSIKVPNYVESWSDTQVISIAEHDLSGEFALLARGVGV